MKTGSMLCVIFKLKHGAKERESDRTISVASTIRFLNVEVPFHSQYSACVISVDRMAVGQISLHLLQNNVVSYSTNAAFSLMCNTTFLRCEGKNINLR
jgi:hypothetical protein